MPNVKIFVDHKVLSEREAQMDVALSPLREAICAALSVDHTACQLAVLPVRGLSDQPQANMEIHYMPTPVRTPQMMTAACQTFASIVEAALGTHIAVRAAALDPVTYIALK